MQLVSKLTASQINRCAGMVQNMITCQHENQKTILNQHSMTASHALCMHHSTLLVEPTVVSKSWIYKQRAIMHAQSMVLIAHPPCTPSTHLFQ
jgi:hypothetical protein